MKRPSLDFLWTERQSTLFQVYSRGTIAFYGSILFWLVAFGSFWLQLHVTGCELCTAWNNVISLEHVIVHLNILHYARILYHLLNLVLVIVANAIDHLRDSWHLSRICAISNDACRVGAWDLISEEKKNDGTNEFALIPASPTTTGATVVPTLRWLSDSTVCCLWADARHFDRHTLRQCW